MKKLLIIGVAVCLTLGVFLSSGCAKEPVAPNDAIKYSETLKTAREKADYLIKQAEALYNSKEFRKAIEVAQYILSKVDANSQPAKNLIDKARVALSSAAQKALSEINKKLTNK